MRSLIFSKNSSCPLTCRRIKFELPINLPKNFPRQKIVEAIKFDKKFEDGKVRFVVTPRIGIAHVTGDVTVDDIREVIAQL